MTDGGASGEFGGEWYCDSCVGGNGVAVGDVDRRTSGGVPDVVAVWFGVRCEVMTGCAGVEDGKGICLVVVGWD